MGKDGRIQISISYVFCVLRSIITGLQESSKLDTKLGLERDVVLSRVFVSEEELRTRNLPLFMNIRSEGVPT